MCLKCTSITTINITNCTTKFSVICALIKVNSHKPRDEFFKTIAFMLIFVKFFITSSMSSRLMIKIKGALPFLTSLTSRWIMVFLSFSRSWIEVVLIQVAFNVVWWCPSPSSNLTGFFCQIPFWSKYRPLFLSVQTPLYRGLLIRIWYRDFLCIELR